MKLRRSRRQQVSRKVRLDPDQLDRLRALSAATHVPVAELIRQGLDGALADERARLAAKAPLAADGAERVRVVSRLPLALYRALAADAKRAGASLEEFVEKVLTERADTKS